MGSILRHVAIRAADLSRSRLFYESIIGLRFVGFRPSGSGSMDLSDGTLNVTLLPHDGARRTPLPEPTEFIHLGFIVEDLDAAFDKCVANGFEILRDNVKERNEPDARPTISFKVADPDGNVIDVTGRKDEWRGVKVQDVRVDARLRAETAVELDAMLPSILDRAFKGEL